MTIYVDIFFAWGHHYVGLFVGSSLSSVTRGLFLSEHSRLFFFFFFFGGGGGGGGGNQHMLGPSRSFYTELRVFTI